MDGAVKALNGHTKWVVTVVSTALVVALGTLALSERDQLHETAERALEKTYVNETNIAVINTNLLQIQATLEEIKTAVKEKE